MKELFEYASKMGIIITITPMPDDKFEVIIQDVKHNLMSHTTVDWNEFAGKKDKKINEELVKIFDSLTAKIGSRKATHYSNIHDNNKREELRKFWANE